MSDESARRFMTVAKNMAGQIPHDVEFEPAVLYALAAPSTPEEVRTNVVDMAARGEKVSAQTVADLKRKLSESKDKERDAKASRPTST